MSYYVQNNVVTRVTSHQRGKKRKSPLSITELDNERIAKLDEEIEKLIK